MTGAAQPRTVPPLTYYERPSPTPLSERLRIVTTDATGREVYLSYKQVGLAGPAAHTYGMLRSMDGLFEAQGDPCAWPQFAQMDVAWKSMVLVAYDYWLAHRAPVPAAPIDATPPTPPPRRVDPDTVLRAWNDMERARHSNYHWELVPLDRPDSLPVPPVDPTVADPDPLVEASAEILQVQSAPPMP